MHLQGKDFVRNRRKFFSRCKKQGTSLMFVQGFLMGLQKFSLRQHMGIGCEPDRAWYTIMVDANGRPSLHEEVRMSFSHNLDDEYEKLIRRMNPPRYMQKS